MYGIWKLVLITWYSRTNLSLTFVGRLISDHLQYLVFSVQYLVIIIWYLLSIQEPISRWEWLNIRSSVLATLAIWDDLCAFYNVNINISSILLDIAAISIWHVHISVFVSSSTTIPKKWSNFTRSVKHVEDFSLHRSKLKCDRHLLFAQNEEEYNQF